jgi:hypothetical protein
LANATCLGLASNKKKSVFLGYFDVRHSFKKCGMATRGMTIPEIPESEPGSFRSTVTCLRNLSCPSCVRVYYQRHYSSPARNRIADECPEASVRIAKLHRTTDDLAVDPAVGWIESSPGHGGVI